jgi:putative endonuclease
MKDHHYFIYILSNHHHTVFYTGTTNDLIRRIYEHKMKLADSFTKKYNLHKLLYYEMTHDAEAALYREKLIKKWKRELKYDAIAKLNPEWKDLYIEMTERITGVHALTDG